MTWLARLMGQYLVFRERAKEAWQQARFGTITETVKSVDGGVASEVEYRGRGGKVVGYWAYGDFDPKMPYRG